MPVLPSDIVHDIKHTFKHAKDVAHRLTHVGDDINKVKHRLGELPSQMDHVANLVRDGEKKSEDFREDAERAIENVVQDARHLMKALTKIGASLRKDEAGLMKLEGDAGKAARQKMLGELKTLDKSLVSLMKVKKKEDTVIASLAEESLSLARTFVEDLEAIANHVDDIFWGPLSYITDRTSLSPISASIDTYCKAVEADLKVPNRQRARRSDASTRAADGKSWNKREVNELYDRLDYFLTVQEKDGDRAHAALHAHALLQAMIAVNSFFGASFPLSMTVGGGASVVVSGEISLTVINFGTVITSFLSLILQFVILFID